MTDTITIGVGEISPGIDLGTLATTLLIDGTVTGDITAFNAGHITINVGVTGLVAPLPGTSTGVFATGLTQTDMSVDGQIDAVVQLGNLQDVIDLSSTGRMTNFVSTAGGDDMITLGIGATMTGEVRTGSGDDLVLNMGTMGRIKLGDGNDTYLGRDDNGLFPDQPFGIARRVDGGFGDDRIVGHEDDDHFRGGAGFDRLDGVGGSDRLYGGAGQDTLFGGEDQDVLFGGNGKDVLLGGNDDDTLNAGNGQDMVIGGRGNDMLSGGSGDDTFFFSRRFGDDTITDFQDGDVIRINNIYRGDTVTGGLEGLVTFENLMAFTTYEDGNALIHVGAAADAGAFDTTLNKFGDSTILLLGVGMGQLTADDFDL